MEKLPGLRDLEKNERNKHEGVMVKLRKIKKKEVGGLRVEG